MEVNWENKIASIIRENEDSISKIKHSLQLYRKKPDNKLLAANYGLQGYKSSGLNYASPTSHDFNQSTLGQPVTTSSNSVEHIRQELMTPSSPLLVNSLVERIDQQAQTIRSLTSTMRELKFQLDVNEKNTTNLRDEINSIKRVNSQQELDHIIEDKLRSWKKQLQLEVKAITNDVRRRPIRDDKDDSYTRGSEPALAILSQDFYQSKKYVEEDFATFQGNLDRLRSRVGKIEVDKNNLSCELQALYVNQDQMKRQVDGILNTQHHHAQHIQLLNEDKQLKNALLQDLRLAIDNIQDEILQHASVLQQLKTSRSIEVRKKHLKKNLQRKKEAFASTAVDGINSSNLVTVSSVSSASVSSSASTKSQSSSIENSSNSINTSSSSESKSSDRSNRFLATSSSSESGK
ncbi:hypothetical protein TrispH2_003646 [Trichoplax sp. H2]|nr:hypothetical protein TrispH2_003646 [Trichoplax sp. H2]|eukprot:RDD43678.1 hypothetical protein TrispH2_003646 [Trichoplax sp. H2]